MRKIVPALLAALDLASPAIASAETERIEIRIPYDDLDLSDPEDLAALEKRIERKVIAACKMKTPLNYQHQVTDWTCVKNARRAAVAQLESRSGVRLALAGN